MAHLVCRCHGLLAANNTAQAAAWFLNCELRAKKIGPAFTFPQLRGAIAQLLRAATGCDEPKSVAFLCTRRLERNQFARYYHHKRRKCLTPLESQ